MKKWHIVGLGAIIVLIAGIVVAEQMTFSTYYPAPAGRYREFSTTGKTLLATDEFGTEGTNARVGIGTTDPQGILHVAGGTSDSGSGSDIILQAENGTISFDSDGGNIILLPGSGNGLGIDGNVGIGTANPKASLEVSSAGGSGFLLPRYADHDAIMSAMPNPEEGMMAYNLADHVMEYHNGSTWVPLGSGGWAHDGTSYTKSVQNNWNVKLDLSPRIGAQETIVLLRVRLPAGTGSRRLAVAPYLDRLSYDDTGDGTNIVFTSTGANWYMLLAETDSNGELALYGNFSPTWEIILVAYAIKQ